jgi:hypothetical protein
MIVSMKTGAVDALAALLPGGRAAAAGRPA